MASFSMFQDWRANKGNSKGQIVLVFFRIAHLATIHKLLFIIMIPYLLIYRILVEWGLNIEIPYKVHLGPGLKLYHAHSLVLNRGVIMGANCTLRQCVTIGNKERADNTLTDCPKIGNNVNIGANVCILGDIEIGDNVIIGAGSIVVKSVPPSCIIAGNPAKIIRFTT